MTEYCPIGVCALADEAGLFEREDVQRALDYFGDHANARVKEILPWGVTPVDEDQLDRIAKLVEGVEI